MPVHLFLALWCLQQEEWLGRRRLLLVNPWITDVAAYDLWAWPLGLLYWASRLREWGFEVFLIDCMDRAHPALGDYAVHSRRFNTGKYHAEINDPQPQPVVQAGRIFRRYGLPPEAFEKELDRFNEEMGGAPDAVVVTSRMTYWYHGVADAIECCRRRWPKSKIALGGIYATLCANHARKHMGADVVFEGNGLEEFPAWLASQFPEMETRIDKGCSQRPDDWPQPAFDLCHSQLSLPLMTSIGCPCQCTYCASRRLVPEYARRSAESVFLELRDYQEQWGTKDFAFYDDALLINSERFFEPLMDRVIASGLKARFHTPNGMHYNLIDEALAQKMKAASLETVRLSLESVRSDRLESWDRKTGNRESFLRAIGALRSAGYERDQLGVYIMAGMPNQSMDEVREAIKTVLEAGAQPKINEYSPIPGTVEWERALAKSGKEIEEEPLWQNNSLYYTRGDTGFSLEDFAELKRLAKSR